MKSWRAQVCVGIFYHYETIGCRVLRCFCEGWESVNQQLGHEIRT
jgi:hypothetical protein